VSKKGKRFIKLLAAEIFVFICAEFRQNHTVLSSTLLEALAITAAVCYARLRNPLPQRSSQRRSTFGLRCASNRLWYGEPNAISNAVSYAKFYSRS
jgi:hypothetical protein